MFWKILLAIYIATVILALFEMLSLSVRVASCVKDAYDEKCGYGYRRFPSDPIKKQKMGISPWVNLFVICVVPLLNAFIAFGIIFAGLEVEDKLFKEFWIFPEDENYNEEDYQRFWEMYAED